MSDAAERAKAALEGVTEGPWTWTHGMDARAMVLGPDNLRVKLEGYRDAEFIASARSLVPELIAEVERLRSYKSLPLDMVWQDYYSPDDVLKIRQPLDAEIEQLRAEVERLNEIIERVGEVADSHKLIEDTQILDIINPNGADR
ncbi:hypothetical protein SEA_NUEVOMUNDO_9 [Mycobacterium phage NuevoMundo]|nr:hypothetical protein SEA_NUEVOMUNDO_9 [Mycobacterium phage NuevoMundo]AVJ48523.1 hypothetical protein SEA_PIER_10 [Mycobacterium phage Pier]QPL13347.1 hypothetical protein SEA_STEPHANIEG_9 [Mycobacterium phage StephanieG]